MAITGSCNLLLEAAYVCTLQVRSNGVLVLGGSALISGLRRRALSKPGSNNHAKFEASRDNEHVRGSTV